MAHLSMHDTLTVLDDLGILSSGGGLGAARYSCGMFTLGNHSFRDRGSQSVGCDRFSKVVAQ